ncbi:MAG TPA: alanine racemase [bacterium]|nr:alanine racemase [bacterium]
MTLPPELSPDVVRSRAWAAVDLDALEGNLRAIRSVIPASTAIMAVVKADAYGHGAIAVARAAMAAGATWLGVATPDEAFELRDAGIDGPILIFGSVAPQWIERLAAAGCVFTVADRPSAHAVASARTHVRAHIKVDTGMTRLGVAPDDLNDLLDAIDHSRVTVEGLYTHLACADEHDSAMTGTQLAVFAQAAEVVRRRFPSAMLHAAASAGAVAFREAALDMVRIGIAMYGVPPAAHLTEPALRPVLTLATRVIRTRRVPAGTPVSYGATYRAKFDTTIATVPLGYGDGYPRALSGVGHMVIRGRRVPVAGRVCMDFTMLDVGDTAVHQGDEVIAVGEGLPASKVAEAAGTISYELLCRLGRRVPRLYVRAGRVVATAVPGSTPQTVEDRGGARVP